jgi:NAD(P)-dependent dehydrogenase (short-subunit alcohol dehydrogenase family)
LAFATNYLGKFALSQMLLSKVPAGGCIVMVGGDGKHKGTLTDWTNPRPGMNAARTASLAVDIYASELAAREPHLRIHTCFPGVVKTNLFRTAPLMMRFYVKLFGTSIRKGSSPITALVTQRHEGVHWNRGIRMHFDPPLPSDNKRLLDYSQAVLENFKRQ